MGKEGRKRILDLAAACVLRDRNATHGEAEDNFATIAEYWTTHLHARGLLPTGVALAREDVAIMSAQIKIARLAQSFDHEDNWVDGAGYMACGGGCAAEVKRSVAATPCAKREICSPPVASVSLLPPANATPAEIQKFFEDVEAAGVRTKENNHLFYDLDREKAKKRELNFREGVLSPPPPEPKAKCGIPCHQVCDECRLPCTCGGAHCAFCTPDAT